MLRPLTNRISELRRLVLSLQMQWQQYLATVELNLELTSYHAEVDRSNSGRGWQGLWYHNNSWSICGPSHSYGEI